MAFTNDQQLELLTAGQSGWDTSLNANMAILERGYHVQLTAGSAINSGQVCVVNSGGFALPLNASSSANWPGVISYRSVGSGEAAQFIAAGIVRSMSLWSGAIVPGQPVYVSTSSIGFCVSSFSGAGLPVGVAVGPTAILFRPGDGGGSGGGTYTLPVANVSSLGGVFVPSSAGLTLTTSGSLTLALDQYSNARGSILYRSSSYWLPLSAGNSGYLLQTRDTGGDPLWVTPPTSVTTSPYDIGTFLESTMVNSETVLRYVATRNFAIASGAPLSQAKALTGAASNTTLNLNKNGSSFATIVWSSTLTAGAYTMSAASSFAAGDVLSITGPNPVDPSLADIAITIAGWR